MKNSDQSASNTSGNHQSFWLDSHEKIIYSPLNTDIHTEILIIGGGIAGLTTAYLLLKSGKKVTLIEDGFIGSGESGRTTAHLTCALDDRYYYLEQIFGKKAAALAAESHQAAIRMIENIVKSENINCNFKQVDGYLFLDPSDKNENLLREFEATRAAGINTALLNNTPGIFTSYSSIKFPSQAQFHILKYLKGLSDSITAMGGMIFTETHASEITKHGAKGNGFQIKAQHIVIATNSPVNNVVTMHTKQAAYRTYVIAGKVPKGVLPYNLWWDTGNTHSRWVSQPYHYVRLEEYDAAYDLLIAGGEDHKTGQADEEHISEQERYYSLELWTRTYFPDMQEIVYYWSGQVLEPVDSLGFMGRNPGDENIYIITGDSGNGMTHTTIGAMIISDIINEVSNPWEKLYDPSRITLNTTKDFLKETANMAAQYLDWFNAADLEKGSDIAKGEGAILISDGSKVAVYRDDDGFHAYSAVCPHLGCIVQWNADEKTFDCPCHGSRFTCEGIVINGPANKNLKKLKNQNHE
jgi:glycine/D-amino acid oxidase-like deaminating enzyme/nitrite reductase/ring-hydroxylating ferredoxin subunit